MHLKEKIIEILPFVERPGRYVGGEINAVVKQNPGLKIGLCYPDLYEIGMGNLALKILYEQINYHTSYQAERVFAVAQDMEQRLKENNLPLYTLETYTPLYQLDMLGFTIPYELVYTNILSILELGRIPFLAKERKEDMPLVIGGGPAVVNPEPIADFFDGFLIGEGEKAILEISEIVAKAKKEKKTKKEILLALSQVNGFYVPSFYHISYKNHFWIQNIEAEASYPIIKRSEPDWHTLSSPSHFVLPWTKVAQDKGMVELFRGCYHRCRFCQATTFYKPVREKDPATIQETIRQIFENTGIREFTLLSLSSGDYSRLEELLENLNKEWEKNYVSFYLPSLKINSFNINLLKNLNSVRKSGLTLAIEAGNDLIRNQINKEVSDEKLTEIVKKASEEGWYLIKLYLMIGLTEDIKKESEAIIDILNKLLVINKKLEFHISINAFIPKPFTAMERQKMYSKEEIQENIFFIKDAFKKNKRLKIKYPLLEMSLLEGILARGNRKLAAIILSAYQKGCRFDGWDEYFNFQKWEAAFEENGWNYKSLLESIPEDALLPWQLLQMPVSPEFLEKERNRIIKKEKSNSCIERCEEYCGACNSLIHNRKAENSFSSPKINQKLFFTSQDYGFTVSFVFHKTGILRFLSQLELHQLFEKILIKAKLPLIFTEGFNPRPKIEFGFTPPVGIESFYENCRFEIADKLSPEEIQTLLIQHFNFTTLSNIYFFEKRPPSLQSISFFHDLAIKKVFVYDKNLLFFIKQNYAILLETEEELQFCAPLSEKIKNWQEKIDIFKIRRLKVRTKDKNEVL